MFQFREDATIWEIRKAIKAPSNIDWVRSQCAMEKTRVFPFRRCHESGKYLWFKKVVKVSVMFGATYSMFTSWRFYTEETYLKLKLQG